MRLLDAQGMLGLCYAPLLCDFYHQLYERSVTVRGLCRFFVRVQRSGVVVVGSTRLAGEALQP
jgi:hypothetical protein